MAINLLALQPNKVSTDLSGYITYLYGAPKTGKTTFGSKMPKPLLLAFEPGYKALPGIIAQDITTWGEMKQVYRELKKPEVKETFQSLIVDTVDIAADLCQKYICNQLGIENMGDGGWGTNSWSKYKKEFDDVFRGLAQMGYAVVFISHAKEISVKDKAGKEHTAIRPAAQSSALAIIENMADIYGYAHQEKGPNGEKIVMLTLRADADQDIACGGRFAKIANEIPFSYEALAAALRKAIEDEAIETNGKYVTNERSTGPTLDKTYDYDALRAEFDELAGELMAKDGNYYGPRIVQIVNKYLGTGKKVSETNPAQGELIYLIIQDIREDLMK